MLHSVLFSLIIWGILYEIIQAFPKDHRIASNLTCQLRFRLIKKLQISAQSV